MKNDATTPENQVLDEITQTMQEVENGNLSHLDAVIKMRKKRSRLEDALKAIKEFESDNLAEIEYQAKDNGNIYQGFKFEFCQGRKTYSYKEIPEWQKAEARKKAIEKKYKNMLEAKLSGSQYANVSEDGEELPLPDLKYSASYFKIKELRQ